MASEPLEHADPGDLCKCGHPAQDHIAYHETTTFCVSPVDVNCKCSKWRSTNRAWPVRVRIDYRAVTCPKCGSHEIYFEQGKILCGECGRAMRYSDGKP